MRKIVPQNGDIFFEAESAVNGIYFSATKSVGPVALRLPNIAARIDKEGNIVCGDPDDLKNEQKNFYAFYKSIEKKYDNIFAIIGIICLFLSIPALFFISGFLAGICLVLFLICIAGSISAGCIGFFIEKCKGNKEIINVLKLHSAEHAVINAYYDLHRVPTLEEIRNYSNFSLGCGSLEKLTPSFWLCIIAILTMFFSGPVYLALIVLSIVFRKIIFKKIRPFFLEFLVTDEPSDKEYKVAIAGLEYSLSFLQDFDIQVKVVEMDEEDPMADEFCKNFSEEECIACPSYEFCKKLSEQRNNENA